MTNSLTHNLTDAQLRVLRFVAGRKFNENGIPRDPVSNDDRIFVSELAKLGLVSPPLQGFAMATDAGVALLSAIDQQGAAITDRKENGVKCARTVCNRMNAVCRHRLDGRMYCPSCARKINEHNPADPPLVEFPNVAALNSQPSINSEQTDRRESLTDTRRCECGDTMWKWNASRAYRDAEDVTVWRCLNCKTTKPLSYKGATKQTDRTETTGEDPEFTVTKSEESDPVDRACREISLAMSDLSLIKYSDRERVRRDIAPYIKPFDDEVNDQRAYAEGWQEHVSDLMDAMRPFADLMSTTSGRIPTERLSFAHWHSLAKAYKYAKSCVEMDNHPSAAPTPEPGEAAPQQPASPQSEPSAAESSEPSPEGKAFAETLVRNCGLSVSAITGWFYNSYNKEEYAIKTRDSLRAALAAHYDAAVSGMRKLSAEKLLMSEMDHAATREEMDEVVVSLAAVTVQRNSLSAANDHLSEQLSITRKQGAELIAERDKLASELRYARNVAKFESEKSIGLRKQLDATRDRFFSTVEQRDVLATENQSVRSLLAASKEREKALQRWRDASIEFDAVADYIDEHREGDRTPEQQVQIERLDHVLIEAEDALRAINDAALATKGGDTK